MFVEIKEILPLAKVRKAYEVEEVHMPNLYRDIFPYDKVCRIPFDNKIIPIMPAKRFRLSDTTFRDGQQSRPPYTVEQLGKIFDFLHRLAGPNGLVTQTEFFLYTKKDRESVELCRSKGYKFPKITSWIRANISDFELVKDMQIDETGILTSVSDYHVYLKLNKTRKQVMEDYLEIVHAALDASVIPRLHLEDITRADIYGFVIPFVQKIVRIMEESKAMIKLRLCDTMGYGVTYPMSALPRSVPKLIRAIIDDGGMPGNLIEWHGHNDFYRAFTNATYAWMSGCETVNATLLGFGERTGNTPLEAMVIEYISLTGDDDGIDTTAITDMVHYFQSIGFHIPDNLPFVGADFNVTSAGIHLDGLLKNEEIYSIFDTEKILNRPIAISINDKSGIAGITKWVNSHLGLTGEKAVDKKDPGIIRIHKEILKQYEAGRVTTMANEELENIARKHLPLHFISDFDKIKMKKQKYAISLLTKYLEHPDIKSMVPSKQEKVLEELMERDPFISFAYVVDPGGNKITKHITQITDKSMYDKKLIDTNYSDRDWFITVMKTGKPYVSNLFVSKITNDLSLTVSGPISGAGDGISGVLGLDIRFEEFAKIEEEEDLL